MAFICLHSVGPINCNFTIVFIQVKFQYLFIVDLEPKTCLSHGNRRDQWINGIGIALFVNIWYQQWEG